MYNATITTNNGKTLSLGYNYGIIFDITPLSGIDVEISTAQSFQQIGESVESTSVSGLTREIFGVIISNEKKNHDDLLTALSAFSSGKLKIGDRYCEFTTKKTPYIKRGKSGRLTFNAVIFCQYPFWYDENLKEYVFGGVTPMFKFPIVYDTHTFGVRKPIETTNCFNDGNVSQAMSIEFTTNASVTKFGISNIKNGKFLQIDETISGNDKVIVYQNSGKIYIDLIRDDIRSNIIRKLVEKSTLFELEVGDNLIRPFAESGAENLNVYVRFNSAYTGVYV